MVTRGLSLGEHLLANVEPDTNGWGCWLWSAGTDRHGYGLVRVGPRIERAHRVAFRLWRGVLTPERPFACHHCDTRPCIRPDHLYAGDSFDNNNDTSVRWRPASR